VLDHRERAQIGPAGQLPRYAGRTTLHLPNDWPRVNAIIRVFARVEDLPGLGCSINRACKYLLRYFG
jgi:hypothetical protein